MQRSLHVEETGGRSVADLDVEIVERKGKGHPDSLIDGACEAVSLGLCEYYQTHFGAILHHNVDKGILVGGRSEPRFGGGRVLSPIFMMVAGRATEAVPIGGRVVRVPVEEIAGKSIRGFIRETMRFLDPDRQMTMETRIRQGSGDLVAVFMRKGAVPVANDTSIGVGYAPLTPTEDLVLSVERLLNSSAFKKRYPEVGEDVKVMGLRRGKRLEATVAAAMVSTKIPDASHYASVMEDVWGELERLAAAKGLDVRFKLNAADNPKHGEYYLTVTGTSAEMGDDGNTGRGNRVNGLISPMRQYSMEATAGKNPVNHTGKILNALAVLTARDIVKKVPTVKETYVRILSRIGKPIDQPLIASAAVVMEKGSRMSAVRGDIESVMDDSLDDIRRVTGMILRKEIELF
ncbi:MAG TPA: methionine adenosyltransferase [Nitrososphaerales archaeon]|nr:methionine adenosyltransferase [Nitrososphaerales archaeon]